MTRAWEFFSEEDKEDEEEPKLFSSPPHLKSGQTESKAEDHVLRNRCALAALRPLLCLTSHSGAHEYSHTCVLAHTHTHTHAYTHARACTRACKHAYANAPHTSTYSHLQVQDCP